MILKFLMATATTFTLAACDVPQAATAQPNASVASVAAPITASVNADALSGNLRGLPVILTDGTQVGVLQSAEINNFGHARLFINTKGYNDVVRTGRVLILTAGTQLVSLGDRSMTINVIRERLINNVSREMTTGRYVRATILN